MKQTLVTSSAKQFEYLMVGDEVVVRNYKKILAFFTVHFSDHPARVREVLALPEFRGSKADEKINWTTELFETTPVRLSSLKGEEREHYQSILQETLDDVRDMVAVLPKGVSDMLHKAVTYHSDDMVFCAEDKVVIAEWGMFPKGVPNIHSLALEKAKTPRYGPWASGERVASEPEIPVVPDPVPEEPVQAQEVPVEPVVDNGSSVGYMPQSVEPEPEPVEEPTQEEVPPVEEPPVDDKKEEKKKKKRWWLWLLLLIPLILLLLLLRKCGGENLTTPPPPVNNEDIGWSDDSLTKIVNNRLVLLFSAEKPVKEFVDDFRKIYPDKDKYQLYAPDMSNDLPRVILTLPMEELDSVAERLPDDFAEYDVMVLPEAIFSGGRTFSDPAFSDRKKSWYFDMISAQVAWDYTIGNPDLIIAVIDDGFDLNHPELKGKEIVKPYNAVAHNDKVYPDRDGIGHGTHVASTALGMANNGAGNCGIAPGCKLMPIQVTDKNGVMTTSAVVDAVLYAIKNDADVVNMSLGGVFNPLISLLPDEDQEEIIKTQFKTEEKMWNKIFGMGMKNGKDMAFVLAGGNDNIMIGIDPISRVEGTVRVSAVKPDKKKADFSNYGEYSVLSAPGVEIYNAVASPNKYGSYDGTSMASPIVAGAYALMKSAYPEKSVNEITELLQRTGIPSPSKVGNIINLGYAFAHAGGGNGQPVAIDPVTGNPVPTDPSTGNPIYTDPVTGNPAPTDSTTGRPIYTDPVTGKPAPTDPRTNEPIYKDPVTGRPAPKDPETSRPIYKDPVTGNPAETDPTTGKPIYKDPYTGQPVQTDPTTGKPIYKDPTTGNPVQTDPRTGRPIYKDPRTGKPIPNDPITGKPLPTDPTTGKPIYKDPITGNPVPTDPRSGKPIYTDPVTGKPAPTDPTTNKPIYIDPVTGNPVQTDPTTGKPIYKDPITQKPVPTDPTTGKPIYKDPRTGNPVPTDPTTGRPIYKNPITGNPIQANPLPGQPNPTDPCPDCTEAQRRYEELMRLLEELKRNNPGCY